MQETFSGWGSAPDPVPGAYSAPPDPIADGQEAVCPLLKNPTPVLSPLGLGLRPRPEIGGLAHPNMTG